MSAQAVTCHVTRRSPHRTANKGAVTCVSYHIFNSNLKVQITTVLIHQSSPRKIDKNLFFFLPRMTTELRWRILQNWQYIVETVMAWRKIRYRRWASYLSLSWFPRIQDVPRDLWDWCLSVRVWRWRADIRHRHQTRWDIEDPAGNGMCPLQGPLCPLWWSPVWHDTTGSPFSGPLHRFLELRGVTREFSSIGFFCLLTMVGHSHAHK